MQNGSRGGFRRIGATAAALWLAACAARQAPIANSKNPTPICSAEALAQGCQDATLLVRVIIDSEGKVGEVRDSPFVRPARDRCAALFRSVTEEAVRNWQFSPAFKQVLVKAASEGPFGQPQWDTQPIPWYADFAFRFRIVGGKGTVVVPVPD